MKSIRHSTMLFFSIVSLIVTIVVFGGAYKVVNGYFEEDLETTMAEMDNTLSIVLRESVFAYDKELTNTIMESFVAFPQIHSLIAKDHRGKEIAKLVEDEFVADANLYTHTKDIIWNGSDTIGTVTITYRMDSNDEDLTSVLWLFIGISFILWASLGATTWVVLGKTVVKRLEVIADAMDDIAQGEGDLTKRIDVKADDEVGRVAKEFNVFVSNLHSLVYGIQKTTEALMSSVNKVRSEAEANTQATTTQLREIEQVATALHEMATTTQEVSQHASSTAEKTHNCNDLAVQGNQIVTKTIDEIHVLGTDLEGTSDKINELQGKSEQINTVLDVINDIADQTNLLALNAAIEAARAGEYGRGFAVVADEVRGLARRTQDSTEEIEQIIKDLQASSSEASQLMSATSSTLRSTIEESAQAIESLDVIITDIQTINDMNTQIATATEEQNVVTEDISKKVVTINELASDVTENTASVDSLSQELGELSSKIDSDLSKFKL